MKVKIGRTNISATIFVPYDCENKCKFCTTKHLYKSKLSYEEVIKKIAKQIKILSDLGITIFTLTGGEPLADLKKCRDIINIIKEFSHFPEELIIYINTSLPKIAGEDNVLEFLNNPENHINGISVSRHYNSYQEDTKLLQNIFNDEMISKINTSVRINCLITNIVKIDDFVERWNKYPNIKINFRANYMKINEKNLHTKDFFYKELKDRFTFLSHTECNVCNTDTFVTKNNQIVSYHKGIYKTSIVNNKTIEINDFVINMFGDCYYDWIFSNKYKLSEEIIKKIKQEYN